MQSVIQEELSRLIRREIRDPRVGDVSITQVEVSQDAGMATISVSIFGETEPTREQEKDCLAGLVSASGYLRRELAKALNTRQLPELTFKIDRGVANTARVHDLLTRIQAEPPAGGPATPEED